MPVSRKLQTFGQSLVPPHDNVNKKAALLKGGPFQNDRSLWWRAQDAGPRGKTLALNLLGNLAFHRDLLPAFLQGDAGALLEGGISFGENRQQLFHLVQVDAGI